jgi:hypothetical protein
MIKLTNLLKENTNPEIHGFAHKGGINLWLFTKERDHNLENLIEDLTKQLVEDIKLQPKLSNLLTPYQMLSRIPSYRSSITGDKILYTGIATKKDLNSKQIEMFKKFLEEKGYKLLNLFTN